MKHVATVFFFASVISSCHDKQTAAQPVRADVKPEAQAATLSQIAPKKHQASIFDMPALMKLSISQIRSKLGPPLDEMQANVTDTERSLIYKKDGLKLTIDYIVQTGQVDDIALTTEHDTDDYVHLESLGNLSQQDTAYSIEPQPGKSAGNYEGVLIRPNPPVEFPAVP
jgi:hypothetical protein